MMLFHVISNDNFICRLHPLIKIILLITTAVFAFLISNIILLVIYLGIILLIIRIFKVKFGKAAAIIKLFMLSLPMLMAVFVLSYLWKEQTYTEGLLIGIREGSIYALRFLNLILMNFLIAACTDPRDILHALKAIKIPDVISQIITHVVNLLPRLIHEVKNIVEAQTLRGMQFKSMWRLSNWMPVTMPIIFATVRYSEQSAISLELRRGLDNPHYQLPKFGLSDWSVGIICILIMFFSIM